MVIGWSPGFSRKCRLKAGLQQTVSTDLCETLHWRRPDSNEHSYIEAEICDDTLLPCGVFHPGQWSFCRGHPGTAADSTALRAIFADPPRQYSSAPLWVWNDMLSEEQVRGTIRDLAGQNVKQVFVHPRPG